MEFSCVERANIFYSNGLTIKISSETGRPDGTGINGTGL
jgi:hypothetical protein